MEEIEKAIERLKNQLTEERKATEEEKEEEREKSDGKRRITWRKELLIWNGLTRKKNKMTGRTT